MILVTVLAVLGSVALLSMMQIGTLKRRLSGKEQELAQLNVQNDGLKQELARLEQEQHELEGRLNDLRNQLTTSTAERERIRTAMEELQTRYKALQDENARFQQQVERITKEREDVNRQLQSLLKEKAALEQTGTKLRNRLAFLDRDYRQLEVSYAELKDARNHPDRDSSATARYVPPGAPTDMIPPPGSAAAGGTQPSSPEAPGPFAAPGTPPMPGSNPTMAAGQGGRPSIELAPIVVRRAQAEVMRSLQARVVDVNQVHQFVVLNKGAEEGVEIGMTFDVLRGGARVGQIVVIRVQPRLAAAEVVPAKTTGFPQVGDLAIKTDL